MAHLHYLILSFLDCHNGGPVSQEELQLAPRPIHIHTIELMQMLKLIDLTSDGYVITPTGRELLARYQAH
jgi:hypothetical protein